MRRRWHERRGHTVRWRFHPPIWTLGDLRHWACSCGKDWWS